MVAQAIPTIDLDDYPMIVDYGTLSQMGQQVFDDILAAAANNTDTVSCEPLTTAEQHEIITHLGLYFGSMEGVTGLVAWKDGMAALDLTLFQAFEDDKQIIDARIDEACASLHPGSDWYVLWQIANYLAKRVTYNLDYRDTLDGLNGRGVCATYSMLFYKMAMRMGIQTYICYGYAGGEYHSWNMAMLDGKPYYYDITWYDNIVHDIRYIHSGTSWGRDYIINNLWGTNVDRGAA